MVSFMTFTDTNDASTLIPTTIDDGPNVLDGFVFSVIDFDPGEVISLNWFLLDQDGNPIGTAAGGNQYGFGVVNLKRVDGGITLDDPVFEGNVGFDQSARSFFGIVYDGGANYEFAVEFGASLTAPFLNPADNSFKAEVNATLAKPQILNTYLPVLLLQPTSTPTPTPTFTPTPTATLTATPTSPGDEELPTATPTP
jgi:hypothetical protein